MKRINYFVATIALVIPCSVSCASKDDFTIMRNTYKDYLIEKTNLGNFINKTSIQVRAELESKIIDGVETLYYPNIDYNDGFYADKWPAADHIANALKVAIMGAKTHDSNFQKIAVGMTYYWVYNDFRSSNWWWNDLGAGASLSSVALFVYDDLNEHGKVALRSRIARTSFLHNPTLLTHTGSNLIDYADNTLKSSIINHDPKELDIAIKRIEEEITDENLEGFQKDGSFFQHGQELQTMSNYGRSVIRIGRILHIISNTSYRFSEEKLKIITNFVLRGIASGTFKGYSNYSEVAREYSRNDTTAKSETYFDLDYFLELPNLPDREKYKEFIDNLKNKRPTFEGIMYFDKAKFVAMNLDGLYMSFKGTDSYLVNTECVNHENKLGLNLSYGTNTCVMDEGDEYYHIAPVWDYTFIPGTTSIQMVPYDSDNYLLKTDGLITKVIELYNDQIFEQQLPEATEENDIVYSSGFDETNQVVHFMQRSESHNENKFTVTCIATKDGMFLMGADLKYTGEVTGNFLKDPTPTIHTTIEQCFYKGSHELSADQKTLIHGNAMYKVYDDHKIILEDEVHSPNKEINGHWNRNRAPDASDQPATGKVLLAYLDTEGLEKNKYAYSVQPKNYENRKFELIKNFDDGKKVQEVKLPSGQLAIASYDNYPDYVDSFNNHHNLAKGDFVLVNK